DNQRAVMGSGVWIEGHVGPLAESPALVTIESPAYPVRRRKSRAFDLFGLLQGVPPIVVKHLEQPQTTFHIPFVVSPGRGALPAGCRLLKAYARFHRS
ncbi:MAG: hypothetical protein AAFW68_08170, partial [Pseudomonadota bacterium]